MIRTSIIPSVTSAENSASFLCIRFHLLLRKSLELYLVSLYFFRHTYYTALRRKNETEKLAIAIKIVILVLTWRF